MIRLAQVGCGGHARRVHGPAQRLAAAAGLAELVACCDLDLARAERFRSEFGHARALDDLDRLLDEVRPDAVVLVVAVERTAEIGSRLLARGVPTLLEKPPGLTVAEVDRLLAAAGETPHQVAFNRRFMPLVEAFVARRPAGLRHLTYDLIRHGRADSDFSTTAIHALDTVRHLAGADYRRVRCGYRDLPTHGPTVADFHLEATLTSGATATVTICPLAGVVVERAAWHAEGESGYLDLPVWGGFDAPGRLLRWRGGQIVEELRGEASELVVSNGFAAETRSFLQDLLAGRRPTCDLASARQSVELMECLRQRRASWGEGA